MFNGRYSDVIISLYATRKNKSNLGRLQLQKFIYLCDTISLLWNQAALNNGYITYKHGPWDQKIQNAVDVLAFRGFVEIDSTETCNAKKVSAFYKITPDGCKLVEQFSQTLPFSKRLRLCNEVSDAVTQRGWNNLLSLVYSEPTYVQEGGIGWGRKLKMNSIMTNISLRVLTFFSALSRNSKISEANITILYFELLDNILANSESGSYLS